MRLLFVDDDPDNVRGLARVLRDAFGPTSEIIEATTVEDAVAALHRPDANGRIGFDIVVTDIFIPLGEQVRGVLGPRARRIANDRSHRLPSDQAPGGTGDLEHLGGLVLLDEIDRLSPAPVVLAHTACTDPILTQLLGERVHARVRKPAPFEVLLNAILEVVREKEAER